MQPWLKHATVSHETLAEDTPSQASFSYCMTMLDLQRL